MDILLVLLALGIAFIAYKVLTGLLRAAVIVLIFGFMTGLYRHGVIG